MPKIFMVFFMFLAFGAGCTPPTVIDQETPGGQVENGDNAGGGVVDPEGESICKDTCGNGSCEEIVCLGTGCPCAETADSCPQDCR
jgi:hypothetical protein